MKNKSFGYGVILTVLSRTRDQVNVGLNTSMNDMRRATHILNTVDEQAQKLIEIEPHWGQLALIAVHDNQDRIRVSTQAEHRNFRLRLKMQLRTIVEHVLNQPRFTSLTDKEVTQIESQIPQPLMGFNVEGTVITWSEYHVILGTIHLLNVVLDGYDNSVVVTSDTGLCSRFTLPFMPSFVKNKSELRRALGDIIRITRGFLGGRYLTPAQAEELEARWDTPDTARPPQTPAPAPVPVAPTAEQLYPNATLYQETVFTALTDYGDAPIPPPPEFVNYAAEYFGPPPTPQEYSPVIPHHQAIPLAAQLTQELERYPEQQGLRPDQVIIDDNRPIANRRNRPATPRRR